MIDEKKIEELRDKRFTCHCVHVPVLLDDMEKLWHVASAAQNLPPEILKKVCCMNLNQALAALNDLL